MQLYIVYKPVTVQTCVDSFVDLEVLGACEDLSTARIRTWKRFLSRVNSDMVDELVLGFERFVGAFTTTPVA